MPRVSRQQTELNRERILESAARLFREQGFRTPSVADLMQAAGLTHGGFYGHFDSKDDLAVQACEHAFAQSHKRWQERREHDGDPATARRTIVQAYLSAAHRDNPGDSCPVSALVGEMAHAQSHSPLQQQYVNGLEQLLALMTTTDAGIEPAAARREALTQYALLVGALSLARATRGTALSDELLEAARLASV